MSRNRWCTCLLCVALVLFSRGDLLGQPVQWSVNSGGNGHFYEAVLVPGGITWGAAESAASAAGGHLVTLTSAAENAFVGTLIANPVFWDVNFSGAVSLGPWMGGRKIASGFEWITGEPFVYTNWAPGEPNNFQGNLIPEDRMGFIAPAGQVAATWNDYPANFSHNDIIKGYVIEWESTWSNAGCSLGGALGAPVLLGVGSLQPNNVNTLSLSNAAPGEAAFLAVATSSSPISIFGGVLKPYPVEVLITTATDPSGATSLSFVVPPAGFLPGLQLWMQFGIIDPTAPQGVALSNAIVGLVP